jgi:hypothetical protein
MLLEFYVFGERVIGWVWGRGGGGTKHFISFEGGEGGIKYFPTLFGGGGAKFYGRILEYPQPPTPVHILYDRSLIKRGQTRHPLALTELNNDNVSLIFVCCFLCAQLLWKFWESTRLRYVFPCSNLKKFPFFLVPNKDFTVFPCSPRLHVSLVPYVFWTKALRHLLLLTSRRRAFALVFFTLS